MNGTPPRIKPLPSRPNEDIGYGNRGPVNGYGNGNGSQRDYGLSPPRMNGRIAGQEPSGRTVLDGYRQDIMNGFEPEKARYNPMNAARPQSSMLLNVNDAIQVHLLVEMALGDSKEYEILSQEEVDGLKKQVQSLSQRIEQTRQNLAIQSKYRDAAINMSRLYSHSSKSSGDSADGRKRRSLLGHNRNSSQEVREAEQEKLAAEKKCEDLATELWSLEKRLMEPQNRLFKHTAGILQMTHKGSKKMPKGPGNLQQGVVPGSPESMYTYHNARNSMEPVSEENFFDERSLYRNADAFGDDGARDDLEVRGPSKEQMKMMETTAKKLGDLNNQILGILMKTNPQRAASYGKPPMKSSSDGETVKNHLNYLEKGIAAIDSEHSQLLSKHQESSTATSNLEQTETVMMGLWDIIQAGEQEVRQRRLERRQTRPSQEFGDDELNEETGEANEAFTLQAFSSKVQVLYTQSTRLKDQKEVLQRQITQQRELNSKSDATKDAEMLQKVEELERTRGLLMRTEKDADSVRQQISVALEDLEQAREQQRTRDQVRSNDDSAAVQAAQQELNQRNKKLVELEEQLQDLKDDSSIANAEMQGQIGDAETKIASLTQQLAVAVEAQQTFESAARKKEQQIEEKEKEMEETNMELARLQTEVTIARAELEGAYGSRAQRAAEVAANPAIQKEIDDMRSKNAGLIAEIALLKAKGVNGGETDEKMRTLKKELEETIEDYEQMTKASIEWEKEREQLEGTIDKMREEREGLDAQLADEKVRWLGMKSPGIEGGNAPTASTSTTVMRNEFKKMMRDARAEGTKALRAEQEERRRLENELRALKKQQGPGKSSLSQSFGSS